MLVLILTSILLSFLVAHSLEIPRIKLHRSEPPQNERFLSRTKFPYADLGLFSYSIRLILHDKYPFNMGVSLSTSQSFLNTGKCEGFNTFVCVSSWNCTQDLTKNLETISTPLLEVSGYPMITSSQLKATNSSIVPWNNREFVHAVSCSGSSGYIGKHLSGIVGFGHEGVFMNNFESKQFSLYIGLIRDSEIIFGQDPLYIGGNCETFYGASSNWVLPVRKVEFGDSEPILEEFDVTFELSVSTILVPDRVFKQVTSLLEGHFGFICESPGVSCTYNGTYEELPTIELYLNDTTYIPIVPGLYLAESYSDEGTFYNLLVQSGEETLLPGFKNSTIVLGSSFMEFYYTTFTAGDGPAETSISICSWSTGLNLFASFQPIVLAIVLSLSIVCIFCWSVCCIKRISMRREKIKSEEMKREALLNSQYRLPDVSTRNSLEEKE